MGTVQSKGSHSFTKPLRNALLLMPDDDFAYLHDWGEVGVVGDVSHDLFR